MKELIKTHGFIKYDPNRPGMKRKKEWWCVLKVNKDVSRYFRYWISKTYGLEICAPPWDCHISIIRGEKPKPELLHLWKKYDNLKVEFECELDVYPNKHGKFFAVNIISEQLMDIRKELHLPTSYGLHMTIGKLYKPLDDLSLNLIYKDKEFI